MRIPPLNERFTNYIAEFFSDDEASHQEAIYYAPPGANFACPVLNKKKKASISLDIATEVAVSKKWLVLVVNMERHCTREFYLYDWR
jgi:hypothetical protein